jgi:hypothetical protein
MSKKAYNHGVVIIKCSGCKNNHLMADHLGWFDSTKKVGTIEDIMKEKGESVERVSFNPVQNASLDKEMLRAYFKDASDSELDEIQQGLIEFLPKEPPK